MRIYRGKTAIDQVWIFGDLNVRGDKHYIFPRNEDAIDSPDFYEVTPETIGQHIGNEGTPIFEGDLYQDKYDRTGVVTFGGDERLGFVAAFGYMVDDKGRKSFYTLSKCEGKVIGNIHDQK